MPGQLYYNVIVPRRFLATSKCTPARRVYCNVTQTSYTIYFPMHCLMVQLLLDTHRGRNRVIPDDISAELIWLVREILAVVPMVFRGPNI